MVTRSSQVRNNFFRRMWTSTSSIVGPEGLCQESFLEMLGGAAVYLGGRVGGLFPCKCWLGLQFRGTSSGMEPGWLECAIRFALPCVSRAARQRMHPPRSTTLHPNEHAARPISGRSVGGTYVAPCTTFWAHAGSRSVPPLHESAACCTRCVHGRHSE